MISSDGKISLRSKGNVNTLNQLLKQELMNLKAGIYILKIANSKESYTAKLVKQ